MKIRHLLIFCPLLLGFILSCAPGPAAETAGFPSPGPDTPAGAPSPARPATPDPTIPTPSLTQREELLTGPGEGNPDSYVPLSPITVADLAAFLRTTPGQLERLNPGLIDPIPAGTLLSVPLDYMTGEGESLISVAEATGLNETVLRWANPATDPQTVLPPDTRLLMPRLFVVYQPMSLAEIAATVRSSPERVRAFNPEWTGIDPIPAGSVLVVPFQ